MSRIKSYGIENRQIPVPKIELTLNQCQVVVNKLTRHFKLPSCKVISKGRTTGMYLTRRQTISLPPKRQLMDLLLHELSHHWDWFKSGNARGRKWHTKKQRRLMERLNNYAKKKNYWNYDSC